MWRWVVYAKDEQRFQGTWQDLCAEFSEQEALLEYLQNQFICVHHQWAQHSIRHFLNYGQTTTSQSESSNHCIKSYLVSGKVDFYGLIKALRQMVRNNKADYGKALAESIVRVRQRYVRHQYLGDLPMVLTRRALDLINTERVNAVAALKEAKVPEALPPCDPEECTTWAQFRVPCIHTILDRIKSGGVVEPLTVEDVDKRWIGDSRVDENHPYLRLRDPERAIPIGRPKNDRVKASELPIELQILSQPGRTIDPLPNPSQEEATPRRQSQTNSQPRRLPTPRSGHRRGRGRGTPSRRLAPSSQRRASHWEEEVQVLTPAGGTRGGRRGGRGGRRTAVEPEEGAQEEVEAQVIRRTRGGRVSKLSAKARENRA